MSDSRSILLKLSVRDADVVRRELVAMGEQGSAALARLDAAARAATGSGGAVSRGGAGGGGSGMAGFRGVVGQAGFQLQDFVVQVQGGTSALTALSQQGSQFLGVFGAGGAVAGAALTVGLLAAQLLGVGDKGDEAGKKIEEAFKAATQQMERLRDLAERVDEFMLSAADRAAALAQRTRSTLLEQGQSELRLLSNQQEAASADMLRAAADFQRIQAQRARLEIDLREASPRARTSLESDLREVQGSEFDARARMQGAQREANRVTAAIAAIRAQEERLRNELSASEAEAASRYGPQPPNRATDPRPGRGTEAGTPDQLRNTLMQLRGQEDERLRREVERFTEGMERPLDAYKRRMAEITSLAERARESGNPIPEEAIRRATDEALGAFNSLARGMEQNNQLGQQLGMTFSSAFEDAIVKGRSFREVLGGIAQDLARLVVRQSITAPLGNMLTKAVGGFDFGSIFSSVFGGGKAVGGPVMGGTTYLVGERGPELFMPAANGNIVPNHALGGVTIQQHVTINAQGAGPREIDVLRAQIPGMVRQTALAAVEDASRRGGGFARNVRGG